MSQSSEHNSEGESSQSGSEYHSRLELESERKQIILIRKDEEFTFLNIWFPLPHEFPNPYMQLNKVMSNFDHALPKPYNWVQHIAKDPEQALGYIIHHFNIDRVSRSLRIFPNYAYDQVYYSTYIDTTRYLSLQQYYKITGKQLQDALVQERLELQIKYARYHSSDDMSPYLLQCFL